ncbi:hypothetical protein D9M70_505520 [compost metagenome]
MQNHQGTLVGGANLIIKTLQVFLYAVELPQPVQISLEGSFGLGFVAGGKASEVPIQETMSMLWVIANLIDRIKDLLTLRQWVFSRSELQVVADEDPLDIFSEECADVLRGSFLLRD